MEVHSRTNQSRHDRVRLHSYGDIENRLAFVVPSTQFYAPGLFRLSMVRGVGVASVGVASVGVASVGVVSAFSLLEPVIENYHCRLLMASRKSDM
jgi:hypothetical protein